MDAAGKDGAIKHVMSGVNPQGCQVHSFKQPSAEELEHDFLWRTTCRLPERGHIGIFNRSYYEEVLVARVHPEILAGERLPAEALGGKDFWAKRYRSMVELEQHLHRNGTRTLKFYLHLSKEEQRRRFLARIDEPAKNWKFSLADLAERRRWDDYMNAYEECLTATSSKAAPWYVVPADDKENARLIISQIILAELEQLKLRYPEPTARAAEGVARDPEGACAVGDGGRGRIVVGRHRPPAPRSTGSGLRRADPNAAAIRGLPGGRRHAQIRPMKRPSLPTLAGIATALGAVIVRFPGTILAAGAGVGAAITLAELDGGNPAASWQATRVLLFAFIGLPLTLALRLAGEARGCVLREGPAARCGGVGGRAGVRPRSAGLPPASPRGAVHPHRDSGPRHAFSGRAGAGPARGWRRGGVLGVQLAAVPAFLAGRALLGGALRGPRARRGQREPALRTEDQGGAVSRAVGGDRRAVQHLLLRARRAARRRWRGARRRYIRAACGCSPSSRWPRSWWRTSPSFIPMPPKSRCCARGRTAGCRCRSCAWRSPAFWRPCCCIRSGKTPRSVGPRGTGGGSSGRSCR